MLLALGEVKCVVAFAPDGVDVGFAVFASEVAGVVFLIGMCIVDGGAAGIVGRAIAALEARATGEHANRVCAVVCFPVVVAIDGCQHGAAIEHIAHRGSVLREEVSHDDAFQLGAVHEHFVQGLHVGHVERAEVGLCQASALEHTIHIGHLAGVEVAHVEVRDVDATIEHVAHVGDVGCVERAYVEGHQRGAAIEHVGHVGDVTRVDFVQLDFCQASTSGKHTPHVGDVLRVDVVQVQEGQTGTVGKHATHVGHLISVRPAQVDTFHSAALEHVAHVGGFAGVEIGKTGDGRQLAHAVEPALQAGGLRFTEVLGEHHFCTAVLNRCEPLRTVATVRHGVAIPHLGDGLLVVDAAGGILYVGVGEVERGVAFAPDGVGCFGEVAGSVSASIRTCIGNAAVVIAGAAAIATFQAAAAIEHVCRVGWRACCTPVVLAEYGAQGRAIHEHVCKVGHLADVEAGQVEAGQALAVVEHARHVCNLAGVKVTQVETCQLFAACEHPLHRGGFAGVQILQTFDFCKALHVAEPGTQTCWLDALETLIDRNLLTIQLHG